MYVYRCLLPKRVLVYHPLLDRAFDEDREISAEDFPLELSSLASWNRPCSSIYFETSQSVDHKDIRESDD